MTTKGTVYDIPDDELLRRAVRHAVDPNCRKGQKHPRWQACMANFLLGSTYSKQLCLRFYLDPDEMVKR